MAITGAWNVQTTKKTLTPALEILVHQVNVDVAASVVLDASAVAPDGITGERVLKAGTPLRKNGNQYQKWVTADATTNPIRGILSHDVYLLTVRQSQTLRPRCGITASGSGLTASDGLA